LGGGLPGGKAAIRLSPSAEKLNHGSGLLRPGDVIEVVTGGSGGYGQSELRAQDAIARDLAEERFGR